MTWPDWIPSWLVGTVERRSPSDIIPEHSLFVDNLAHTVTIDFTKLNIPFTLPPRILPIMYIPNSNSMDGYMDYGNNAVYIAPYDATNHKILCDWLESEFRKGAGNDVVYRVMFNNDSPTDFTKEARMYAIHRIINMGYDSQGRWWHFKGINNPCRDLLTVRDFNILYLNCGIIN